MKVGLLCFGLILALSLQLCDAIAQTAHAAPNVEAIIAKSHFSEAMKESVRRRVDGNYREDLFQQLTRNVRKISEREKKEAPIPQPREMKHQPPIIREGMMRRTGARSTHSLVPFDYFMLARREMSLYEESIVNMIASWLGVFRIGEDAEFFFNTVVGLSQMALNLSLTAGEKYDGFVDWNGNSLIPWYNDFTTKIVCDLDFKQKDPDTDYGTIFNFPDFCVEDVQGAYFRADSTQEIQDRLYYVYGDTILDNHFNNIAMGCVHPEAPDLEVSNTAQWFCFMYFVKLTDIISANTCKCAESDMNCCPYGYGI